MTEAGERSTVAIQSDILAGQLGVEPAVADNVLALEPVTIADNLAGAIADHEHGIGDRYDTDEGISTFVILGEDLDLASATPEVRASAAVYALRLLGKLGITKFDMGAAN
jgi:hypothetical protein